jgi:hypothetical protein
MSLLKSSRLIKDPVSSRNALYVMRRLFVDGQKHPAGMSFMMIASINGCLKAKPAPSIGGEL